MKQKKLIKTFMIMARVRNVSLNYDHSGETSFPCIGRGQNVFPTYAVGWQNFLINNGANSLWGQKSMHTILGQVFYLFLN